MVERSAKAPLLAGQVPAVDLEEVVRLVRANCCHTSPRRPSRPPHPCARTRTGTCS